MASPASLLNVATTKSFAIVAAVVAVPAPAASLFERRRGAFVRVALVVLLKRATVIAIKRATTVVTMAEGGMRHGDRFSTLNPGPFSRQSG